VADLIFALVLLLVAAAAAELVRGTCRRQLLTPLADRTVPTGTSGTVAKAAAGAVRQR
jgi:hypothetical protein